MSQAVQQAETRGGVQVSTVIALATHMQVQVLVCRRIGTVAMFMGVQLKAKGRAHSQRSHHQQSDTHQKFCPGGHRLNMSEILEADRHQRQDHDPSGMARSPGQT